jgi:PKD repeat protein
VLESYSHPLLDYIKWKETPDHTIEVLNETIDLIDLSSNGPTSWKWVITPATFQWMNGTDSSSQFPKVKFTADGQYTITLSATNIQGTHSVQKANIVTVAPSNVNAINKPIFTRIYPNPSSDNVTIISNEIINSIAIFNLKGQILFEELSNTNLININIAELENGYYYAILKTQNGIVTHKLSVQH